MDDHGTLLRVSYQGYERALAAQDRVFTSVPGVFYAIGVVVNMKTPAVPPAPGRRHKRK
jgi:hypothetical protein